MFEDLTTKELEQFDFIVASLYFYGRKRKTDLKIYDYNTALDIVKEKIGLSSFVNVMEALEKDKYIKILQSGATALTEKGIDYAKQKFKKED